MPDVNTDAEEKEKDVLVTPDGRELDQSVLGTVKLGNELKEEKPAKKKNLNRFASFKFALAGLLYILVHEQSVRLISIATVGVVIAGIWLGIRPLSWALLALAVGIVWVTEALNTAIEAAIDLEAPDPQPLAKIAKDVASAASLVSTLVFIIVAILILTPYVDDQLPG